MSEQRQFWILEFGLKEISFGGRIGDLFVDPNRDRIEAVNEEEFRKISCPKLTKSSP
jgi:hypothetical protein